MAKRTKYPIHKDFKKWANFNPPLGDTLRPAMQKMMSLLWNKEKSTKNMTVERKSITSYDGVAIRALWYCPKDVGDNAPCLIYFHGGGFVIPAANHHYALTREYAERAHCKALFVDYRLAPKYKFPVATEDCYAAYCWVVEHAAELGVDVNRIGVGGDSAGGELATVVCLMAKDRGQIIPCCQMLLYPAVGNVDTESMRTFTDTPLCNSKDIEVYGKLYIPEPFVGNPIYCSPIDAESLEGMPAAYIETAEFDALRDGGVLYAEKLQACGVAAELYNTKGTIHGFDMERKSAITRDCVDKRVAFLQRCFETKNKKIK